ncbi:conserved hypothetical protein [Solidesulfovibrio fructosivorans JJ]]|uniref:Uncharacterized protein n=1 Tax=Solidesulfovibrio fructosivorans JJ] TaxID=596151 RepID=E1JRK8_SOLFR|nr:hypothetical protein [Solidesulfovibrio fructosivorans]EFL53209.1 conserved hypothetical protein [Solidesulfovibrio fructosivorans JJ]]
MNGLLFFPGLHPGLAGDLPAGVRLLDPGLGEADEARLRPDALPLRAEELHGCLRECDRLRRETKDPKDLALLAGYGAGHFFADTSFAAREEIEDHLHPERVAARRLRAAQLSLCLAYRIEESLLELVDAGECDARFAVAMAESLGLTEDDADEELIAALAATHVPAQAALAEEFRPPWRQLLPPFWAIAPEGAGLFIADPEIADSLLDAGLPFAPLGADALATLFPEGAPETPLLAATLPGWRLRGNTRPDPEAPWLDAPRTIVIPKP